MKCIRVLIVDDQEDIIPFLKEAFVRDSQFAFEVYWASSVEDYLGRFSNESFDVFVIDLDLEDSANGDAASDLDYAGNLLIEEAAREFPNAVIAVYSAYPTPEFACCAGRRGADLFVEKTNCTGMQLDEQILVERIKRELTIREQLQMQRAAINEYFKDSFDREKYRGRHVVVVNNSTIVNESTRLKAICAYRKYVRTHPNKDLPRNPLVVYVV